MTRGGENSDSIPIDLIIEILSGLPAKSIARFRFVSKLWCSMFLRPYFTNLFLTRSSARPPRLLSFDVDEWSSLDPYEEWSSLDPYEEWSLVVTADVHMMFRGNEWPEFCGHASGLIYFRCTATFENDKLGQYASLPSPEGSWRSFLGFDPMDKHVKLFSISFPNYADKKENEYQILTLGTGNDTWRKIDCPLNHVCTYHLPEGICINGVLYYLAQQIPQQIGGEFLYVLVCFDVRSEKFRFIYRDFIFYRHGIKLFNYKGKLGVITLKYDCYAEHSFKLCMWVINDVENQDSEWPKHFAFCWDNKVVQVWDLSIIGVSATGEIVFSMMDASKPFYVFYLNPEKNTLQMVKIQGSGANQIDNCRREVIIVDHVEDLKFITMKSESCTHEHINSIISSSPATGWS